MYTFTFILKSLKCCVLAPQTPPPSGRQKFFGPTVFSGLKNGDDQIFSLIGHVNQFLAFSAPPIRRGCHKMLYFKKFKNDRHFNFLFKFANFSFLTTQNSATEWWHQFLFVPDFQRQTLRLDLHFRTIRPCYLVPHFLLGRPIYILKVWVQYFLESRLVRNIPHNSVCLESQNWKAGHEIFR